MTNRENLRKALNVIHDSFFLSEYQVLNLFVVGIGTVGGNLLEQIYKQRPKLMKQNGLQLNVVGIATRSRMLFDRGGIDLADYRRLLTERGVPAGAGRIEAEVLGMNIFNPVFVDCTASAEIASLYRSMLEHNISVVAANKIAASSAYDAYSQLKDTARRRGVKYLFETNVGGGVAYHQHDEQLDKQWRPHPEDAGGAERHAQLYIQHAGRGRAAEPCHPHGAGVGLLRTRPAH